MIWLTWRQLRPQAITAFAALAAFAVLLATTGPHLGSLYATSGIGGCQGSACRSVASEFLTRLYTDATYWVLDLLGLVVVAAAPVVIGMFWGAPLIARELEAGTHHLAWNQSVTRTRWLAVKLALTGLVAVAVTEALSLMQAWWAAPISQAVAHGGGGSPIAMGPFNPLLFATHGITPIAYAAFAFVLGVTAGVLVRRAVPAMAITLGVFAVLQVGMALWVRPHLFPPEHTIATLGSISGVTFLQAADPRQSTFTLAAGGLVSQPDAWILSSGAVDAAGHPVSIFPAACLQASNDSAGLDCLASSGIRVAVTYEPASSYWTFEWTETAIFIAMALALTGFCFWRLSRRLT